MTDNGCRMDETDEQIKKLKEKYPKEFKLMEHLRPMMDAFADHNNLCAYSFLDDYYKDEGFAIACDFRVRNHRRSLRGPFMNYYFHTKEEHETDPKLVVEIDYNSKPASGGLLVVRAGINGDKMAIKNSQHTKKQRYQYSAHHVPQYELPPNMFTLLPEELKSTLKEVSIEEVIGDLNIANQDLSMINTINWSSTRTDAELRKMAHILRLTNGAVQYTFSNSQNWRDRVMVSNE